jgi:hypothetical protein
MAIEKKKPSYGRLATAPQILCMTDLRQTVDVVGDRQRDRLFHFPCRALRLITEELGHKKNSGVLIGCGRKPANKIIRRRSDFSPGGFFVTRDMSGARAATVTRL